MSRRLTRAPAHRRSRPRRGRLLVVVLAPFVVLVPLTAFAASTTSTTRHAGTAAATKAHPAKKQAATTGAAATQTATSAAVTPAVSATRLAWSRSWNPALALLSDYQKSKTSTAGFATLGKSFAFAGSQKVTATVVVKTRWVDVKALVDGPNIAQQGRYASSSQFKLQIAHGPSPSSHRAQCRIKGATGSILAFGPSIDVADGQWHTITCVKSPDGAGGTKVVVTVDGVAGHAAFSRHAIGAVSPPGRIDLGGRSSKASSDSLDGWIRSLSFSRR